MRQKEIFFRHPSFIICITLIVSLVAGTEVLLPIRSEIRLSQKRGCIIPSSSDLFINQEKDEVRITGFINGVISGGIISTVKFESFWDSLNTLNFWKLKKVYSGQVETTDEITGELLISYEKEESVKITKKIYFTAPNTSPKEFKRIYDLIQSMGKFAADNYDRNFLDSLLLSLLINLPKDEDYTKSIIQSLWKARDKRVISAYITALEKESKKKKLNDEIIGELIKTLTEFTGQRFPFNPSDSVKAKKETVNKWINWWEENKDKFK